jgi:hypothetical protein
MKAKFLGEASDLKQLVGFRPGNGLPEFHRSAIYQV